VVGDGPEKGSMMLFCEEHQLDRVEFFGKCDPNPFYKKSKVFNMTSAFEGFGNVLVEAQSYGCVPIMFNSYSAAQDIVLDHETGLLIKPFNIDKYVCKTLELIVDKDRLNNYAENAIKHSTNYSYEATYKKWESVLESIPDE
jgi:glycosyltransferase involved in cell wall biosynthesis